MGTHPNIGASKMPKQGEYHGAACEVVFDSDSSAAFRAICARDDVEAPFLTVLWLGDGRLVLGTECQYRALALGPSPGEKQWALQRFVAGLPV